MTRVLELFFMRFSRGICDTHLPCKVHCLRKLMWKLPMWSRLPTCDCHEGLAMSEQECQCEVCISLSMASEPLLGRGMV